MKFETVKNFIEAHPEFTGRKDRYLAEALYFGMESETMKEIQSFDRYLRDIWEKDSVGEKLEKEWHKPDYIHNTENNQLFKTFII